MNSKYKVYLKLNMVSLFFLAVSFISISLAWFAYSGLSKVSTEIGVKTWYVEFQKDNKPVSNDIVVSLSDIYPGMETINESVRILNKGDSNAQLSYSIVSARVLDDEIESTDNNEYVEDVLAHDYPFKININLDKKFILAKEDESYFNFSVSWPLDSDNDNADSEWGTKAYQFQQNEQEKQRNDSNYIARTSLKVVISVKAEQYLEDSNTSDINYPLGKTILYDVVNNSKCERISDTCLKTYVIDANNKLGDNYVTLLPDLFNNYQTGNYNEYESQINNYQSTWNVNTRALNIKDILNIISTDVSNSFIKRENLSDAIIGDIRYSDRTDRIINNTISYNGYFTFLNSKYNYLSTSKCIWINNEYKDDKAFALTKVDDNTSKVYGENKSTTCSVVPVIIVEKNNLN